MLGEDEDNEEEGSFNSKSIWARMAIVFAGPFFNFILAFVLALIIMGAKGADVSYVTQVNENSPAYEAGLRIGDRITKYNGAHAALGREIYLEDYVNPLDGSDITVSFIRDGKEQTITYTPDKDKRYMVGMSYNDADTKAQITQVTRDSAMFKAGVEAGDVVTEIDGTAITTGKQMAQYLEENPFGENEVSMTLLRDNKEIKVTVKPQVTQYVTKGFSYNLNRERQSVGGVIKYSFIEVRYEIVTVLKSLKMLVTGQVSADEVSGPVGIVDVIGDTYTTTKSEGAVITILTLINLAIMLSANLGVMNLLPIPALDGGRIFLYLIEIITRKKIPKDKEGMIHFIGFIILMALMVFLIFNDIRKLL
jgi:regulator of sigma E protease